MAQRDPRPPGRRSRPQQSPRFVPATHESGHRRGDRSPPLYPVLTAAMERATWSCSAGRCCSDANYRIGQITGLAAGAAVGSTNTAAATSNVYAASVATGNANAATATAYNAGVTSATFAMGGIYAVLPAGC